VKVIAGTWRAQAGEVRGPVEERTTRPLYLDVDLPPHSRFAQPLDPALNAFVYVYEGSAEAGGAAELTPVPAHTAAILGSGEDLLLVAGPGGTRFLLLAGRPLNEPIVQYGPFVMNTQAEIR